MQDEEIPSNQTFVEAVEYMRDKVETWRREIIASSERHVSAVLNLRRHGHNASAEERDWWAAPPPYSVRKQTNGQYHRK